MDSVLDIVLILVIEPLFDMLDRRRMTGKWHFSYFLPISLAVFVGVCWLASYLESSLLWIIGGVGLAVSAILNLLLLIPRWLGEREDFNAYIEKRRRSAEENADQEKE